MTATTTVALDKAACRKLLSRGAVGRVGYIADGRPMIVPVDYTVVENLIVFRTMGGAKLEHVPLHHVCFEIDGRIPDDGFWSVVVHGFARDVTTAINPVYKHVRETTLASHIIMHDPHWVAIDISEITGRRLADKTD
jgi:nitroimidazol reductase NimA-like FMN-containing flavoprotein (pyridoxamine 5'-phosphate oxidase superfamily)